MIDALLAADLVVARAGASVLGEFTTAGLPAILVPLPIAGVNQLDNARWVEAQGGAVILENDDARTGLLPLVQTLFSDSKRLAKMKQAMQAAAHPNAAKTIATILLKLGHTSH
jgi:UDP-N-acetylglucosamine--N-acetylmuramyl-(pentapeptide) pyrophosphoryl-undecaprenol N-acetylglucosamine transferase